MKGKRFQTIDEIQENTARQLTVIGRTVEGPKGPTLKETGVPLSCVHCFLYLVSSSINSIFHIAWLDTFWTDLVFPVEIRALDFQMKVIYLHIGCLELDAYFFVEAIITNCDWVCTLLYNQYPTPKKNF